MSQSLNNSLYILKAGLIEMLQIGQNFLVFTGIPVSILKKFRRCDAEVFADIKENLHGREAVPIFERINVTGTLSDGQAHVPCRYAFIRSQFCQPFVKQILIHMRYHPLYDCTLYDGWIYLIKLYIFLDLSGCTGYDKIYEGVNRIRGGKKVKMEKRYYTKSKEELEEIRAELQAEREAMTEEEWLAEQLENERGFQRLMERLECEQKKYKRIRNPEKEEAFKKMQAIGVKLARRIEADLIIENNEEYGCIKLTTGLILFGKPTRNAGKREFLRLMRAADDILIRPEEEAFESDLRFDFFDEIAI